MYRVTFSLTCLVALAGFNSTAMAQRVTVQEPVLETFGVATSVSVPDRGRMPIGGVSRSASSRSMSGIGPFRSGSNMGFSQSASHVSVGATIHDLEAMDRQVLGQAQPRSGRVSQRPARPGSADYAYEALLSANPPEGERTKRAEPKTLASTQRSQASARVADTGPAVERLLKLAETAESNGKRELALAYLRSARDSGSQVATHEIERLSAARKSPR